MLKIGNQSIAAVFLGGAKIKKAYLGEAVVFDTSEPPVPTYTISASIDPAGSGTVSGAGTYQAGETVTITAAPGDGYQFTGWQENSVTVSDSATYTFTATGDRMLMAVFEAVKISRLPVGYTEVEYIQPETETSYFEIATAPRPNSRIEGIFELVEKPTATRYIMYYFPDGSHQMNLTVSSSAIVGMCSSNTSHKVSIDTSSLAYPYTIKYEANLSVSPKTLKLNTQSVACTWTYTDQYTVYLGRGRTTNYKAFLGARIKYLKMSTTSYAETSENYPKFNCELIPCITPKGVVGLYDLTNKKEYTPASGSFTAGPAV